MVQIILKLTVALLICGLTFWSGDARCRAEEKPVKESPIQQCERLMDALLPFAEEMLVKHGEFYPFGGALNLNGKVINQGAWTGQEHSPSEDVIKVLHEGLKKGAEGGEFLATALVYDVKVIPPGKAEKTDAVAVDVDHRDGVSQTVIYPYCLEDGKPSLGQTYAIPMQHPVFER
jgi:hypothetical protein